MPCAWCVTEEKKNAFIIFIVASSVRWAGRVACVGDRRVAFSVSVWILVREREWTSLEYQA